MKKLLISLVLVFSFSICASAQQSPIAQKAAPAKTVQSVDKSTLNKKTITLPKTPTNWSKIKDLFR
jgi:hypothetical protein